MTANQTAAIESGTIPPTRPSAAPSGIAARTFAEITLVRDGVARYVPAAVPYRYSPVAMVAARTIAKNDIAAPLHTRVCTSSTVVIGPSPWRSPSDVPATRSTATVARTTSADPPIDRPIHRRVVRTLRSSAWIKRINATPPARRDAPEASRTLR